MSTIDPVAPKLVLPGKVLAASAGSDWIGGGWALFRKAPLIWVVLIVMLFVVSIVLSIAGAVGSILYYLVSPLFAAGFAKGCQSMEQGGELEFEHIFAGFSGDRLVPLLILGAIFIAAYGVLLLVFAMFAGVSVLSAFMAGDQASILALGGAVLMPILLGLLVVTTLAIPVMMANWFAPTLVMLHGLAPLDAAKESFRSCMSNFLPFLVYGLLMGLLGILALIPFGLGLLVWVPVLIASTYVAYRQIYTEGAPGAQITRPRSVSSAEIRIVEVRGR